MTKNKFAKDISFAETQSVNFDQTILATPSQIKCNPLQEYCTRKVNSHIKLSEYECFVSHIGRMSVSKALRMLVIDFNQKQDAKKQTSA